MQYRVMNHRDEEVWEGLPGDEEQQRGRRSQHAASTQNLPAGAVLRAGELPPTASATRVSLRDGAPYERLARHRPSPIVDLTTNAAERVYLERRPGEVA